MPGERRPKSLVLLESEGAPRRGDAARPALVHVLGTRSDAVTLAPVIAALDRSATFDQHILQTGQDTGTAMVDDVLADLGVPAPDRSLGLGPGSRCAQTASALAAAGELLAESRPAAVVVTGAADSVLGCGLAAAKLDVPVARVEAGLREYDWSVPEEVNRVLLDTLADSLFASSAQAAENLSREGIGAGRVHLVGSTAVDSIRRVERRARERAVWRRYGIDRGGYVLATLNRPANLDDDERLARIVEALAGLARRVQVILPLRSRTRRRLEPMGDAYRLQAAGVRCGPPLSYLDFVSLQAGAGAIVTDSGIVQEESTALGVNCFTLGSTTERTVTVTHGTNSLLGDDPRDIAEIRLGAAAPAPFAIPLWDGGAGERIAAALVANYALVRSS